MEKIETFTTPETRFLSNFYPYKNKQGEKYPEQVCIEHNGLQFDCVETAYQAAKTTDKNLQRLFTAMTPYEAKAFWNGKESQIRTDWFDIRDDLMFKLCFQKFFYHPPLMRRLLATGDTELIEGNTWGDVYWGVCDGVGENRLGQILQKLRDKLRNA